jgi:hypothetical protein
MLAFFQERLLQYYVHYSKNCFPRTVHFIPVTTDPVLCALFQELLL